MGLRHPKQTMQQSTVLSSLGAAPPPSLIEDHEFLTHKVGAILAELDRHLAESSKRAETLVGRQQGVGDVLGELGMALIKLANYEVRMQTALFPNLTLTLALG